MVKETRCSQISDYQRWKLKALLEDGLSKVRIAEKLNVSRGTVFNELKRGTVNGVYDPEYASAKALEQRAKTGCKDLLGNDRELANYISKLIRNKMMSPEQVVEHLKLGNHGFEKYPKSVGTIYAAIDKGFIPGVTRQEMKNVSETKIVTMQENSILLPACIRKYAGLRNGNSFKIQCKKNGEVVLKKI